MISKRCTEFLKSLALLSVLPGCVSLAPPGAEPPRGARTAPPVPTAQTDGVQKSALSYGSVTSRVQKNKTTQLELIQIFGGPNISSVDADGTEVWVYERSVTETDVQNRGEGYQAAANLGVFFSSVNAGVSGSTGKSSSTMSAATSFRSLTVIVKFNGNKTVKDYSVRASQF